MSPMQARMIELNTPLGKDLSFKGLRGREELGRSSEFELTAFWEQWSRSFEATLPRVQVTVRVDDDVRRWLPGEPRVDEHGRAVVAFAHLGEMLGARDLEPAAEAQHESKRVCDEAPG